MPYTQLAKNHTFHIGLNTFVCFRVLASKIVRYVRSELTFYLILFYINFMGCFRIFLSFFMSPASKKLRGHIGLGLSVRQCIRPLRFPYGQERLEIGS